MIALLDNTVMSNFAAIERPDLLRDGFGSLAATTQHAFDELQNGVRLTRLPDVDWSWLPVWTMEEVEISHFHRFLSRLNAGEASCLAVALSRGCAVLTDDRDAREIARRLRIPLSGTLGALVRLVDIAALILPEADACLADMIASGYRSPVLSLRDLA